MAVVTVALHAGTCGLNQSTKIYMPLNNLSWDAQATTREFIHCRKDPT